MNNRCGQQMRLCTGRKQRGFFPREISSLSSLPVPSLSIIKMPIIFIGSTGVIFFLIIKMSIIFIISTGNIIRVFVFVKICTEGKCSPFLPKVVLSWQVLDPIEIASVWPLCPSHQLLKKYVRRQIVPHSLTFPKAQEKCKM